MANCVDCASSYIDDIYEEWHCKKDHFVPTDNSNCPIDKECEDYDYEF